MSVGVQIRPSQLHHIGFIDIKGNGILSECAIMKRDRMGNIYYFEVRAMDNIDKRRLRRIIEDRNAPNFELWDLLSQKTLGNGMNALTYFHQYVRILTPNRQILKPNRHEIGSLSPQQIVQLAEARRSEALRRAEHAKTQRAKEARDEAERAAQDAGMQQSPFAQDGAEGTVKENLSFEMIEDDEPPRKRSRGRPRKSPE